MSDTGLSLYFSRPLMQRSLMVALVAGTLLTIVNQWQAIVGDSNLDQAKVALTYVVPFLVSSISAYLTMRGQMLKMKAQMGCEEI